MKNFCDKCQIYIYPDDCFCPLCGRCCNPENADKKNKNYPSYNKTVDKKRQFINIIFGILIILTGISLLLDVVFQYSYNLFFYFFATLIFVFFTVIAPIRKNFTLVGISSVASIFVPLYILFIELYSKSFGWGLYYVIPLSMVLDTIYSLIILVSRSKNHWDFILNFIVIIFISLAIFIANIVLKAVIWPSFIALVIPTMTLAVIWLIKSSKTSKELGKNFHI